MSRVGAKKKIRRAKHTCVCVWCRLIFQATRKDAKTCTPRCRKALSRYIKETGYKFPSEENEQTKQPRLITINRKQQQMIMEF